MENILSEHQPNNSSDLQKQLQAKLTLLDLVCSEFEARNELEKLAAKSSAEAMEIFQREIARRAGFLQEVAARRDELFGA